MFEIDARPDAMAIPADDQERAVQAIEQLVACGPVIADLPSRANTWSPEKRLAGAILATALIDIRDHHGERSQDRRIVESLRWINADDLMWPFSFVRLCHLFDLEPTWVRAIVARWMAGDVGQLRTRTKRYKPRLAYSARRAKRAAPSRRGVHAAMA